MIDPNEYRKLIEAVELAEMYFTDLQAWRDSSIDGQLTARTQMDIRRDPVADGNHDIVARVTFLLQGFLHETKDTSKEVVKIKLEWLVRYSYQKARDFHPSNDLVEEFVQRNVPVNVWPYIRYIVSMLTIQMCLPPLILPMWKMLR